MVTRRPTLYKRKAQRGKKTPWGQTIPVGVLGQI